MRQHPMERERLYSVLRLRSQTCTRTRAGNNVVPRRIPRSRLAASAFSAPVTLASWNNAPSSTTMSRAPCFRVVDGWLVGWCRITRRGSTQVQTLHSLRTFQCINAHIDCPMHRTARRQTCSHRERNSRQRRLRCCTLHTTEHVVAAAVFPTVRYCSQGL